MENLVFEFTLIILFTTGVGLVGRQLKFPSVLTYILTGVMLTALHLSTGTIQETLEILSTLGIAFLLFLIGIELNITELRAVGKQSIIVGVGQIFFTGLLGMGLALLFNFTVTTSLIIALALTFSSTIIAIKLLSSLGDVYSLHGRMSIGILLVQDLVAIFVLILISLLQTEKGVTTSETLTLIGLTLAKIALLILITLIFVYAGKRIFGYIAQASQQQESTELFLLGTFSWVLAFTFVSSMLGLSLEIGAFLAGLSLSGTGYSIEIVAKIKPFRDFFIILFFILLGSEITFSSFEGAWLPILVFSLLVFLGNPFIVLTLMRRLGFSRQTNFLTGLTVSQTGEFSLILAAGAFRSGLIDEKVVSMITLVAVITIALSSYAILHGVALYKLLKHPLTLFGPSKRRSDEFSPQLEQMKDHTILIGSGRIGEYLYKEAKDLGLQLLVVDYDPVKVKKLQNELEPKAHDGWLQLKKNKQTRKRSTRKENQIKIIYGDVTDAELFDEIGLDQAKLIISTLDHFEDNLIVAEEVKRRAPNIQMWSLVRAEEEIKPLEEAGVDYVMWPQQVARVQIGEKLRDYFTSS